MDDFIAGVMLIFQSDSVLQQLFGGDVNAIAPRSSEEEAYPKIVVTAKDGATQGQGEAGDRISNGEAQIEVYTREQDGVSTGNTADRLMWLIANRCTFIMVGDPKNNNYGIVNARLRDKDNNITSIVTICRKQNPSGPRNSPDPKERLHVGTYKVQILRPR